MMKIDIKSLLLSELEEEIKNIGEKGFRAKQIYSWLHEKNAKSFAEMSNLSNNLREKLSNKSFISELKILKKMKSRQDDTTKYLFQLENDTIIESVLMKYSFGNSVCVSSQAGCRMGCKFCASTIGGIERNLTSAEMLSQVYEIQSELGERISNVVIMGSGEPLDNYENTLKFIRILNSEEGLKIGQRHITLSTCGLVDKIAELQQENLQINLAISLHAPNDEIRKKLMPIAKTYSMAELISACNSYSNATKRRITYEYALIHGVNDSRESALELAKKLSNTLSHVNLIPVNNVDEQNFRKSSKENILAFSEILKKSNVETTIRRELGSDINAACGQLRKSYLERGV